MKNHILTDVIFCKFIIILSFSLFLSVNLHAKKKDSQGNAYSYEWHAMNSARKKADTSLGTLFYLPKSHDFFISKISDNDYDPQKKALNTLSVVLFKKQKDAHKLRKKFLVLDFAFRYSPVKPTSEMLKERAPSLPIFGWSKKNALISNQFDLDAVWLDRSQYLEIADPNGVISQLKTDKIYCKDNQFLKKCFYFYGVNYCRIIIDQKDLNGFHSINLNGYKTIFKFNFPSKQKSLPEINSFALASDIEHLFLEVSPITIQHYDKESDLAKLSVLNQKSYDYSHLLKTQSKEYLRNNKIEHEYMQGMKLLYQEFEWENGFQLLERAAKKDHALAIFQLGCAYYRGIGCRKDLKLAKKYLKEAAEMNVYGAERILSFLLYQENFPLTYAKNTNTPFKVIKTKQGYDIANMDSYPTSEQEISGNDKWMRLCHALRHTDLKNQKNILDQLCREQYASAFFFRALKYFSDLQYRGDQSCIEEMLSDFHLGSLLGNEYSTIFLLKSQLLLNRKNDTRELTESEIIQSINIPTFHLLHYMKREKKFSLIYDFARGDYRKIIDSKPKNADEHFIRSVAILHTFLFSDSDTNALTFILGLAGRLTPYSLAITISQQHQKEITLAFHDLQIAAASGIPEAQYLLGVWLLEKRSPRYNFNQGKKNLILASETFFPAAIKLTELSLATLDYDNAKKYLLLVKNSKSLTTLDLSAKLYLCLAPTSLQTLQKVEEAANTGSLDSILFLSDYFMKRNKKLLVQTCRKMYLTRDSSYCSQRPYLSSWPLDFCIIKPRKGNNKLPLTLEIKGITEDECIKIYHIF